MPLSDNMTLSPALYLKMIEDCKREMNSITGLSDLLRPKPATMYGIPVHSNPMFPMNLSCPECSGTGEGVSSTYCPRCKGTGGTRTLGVMQNRGQTIMINDTLPKKFMPSFPKGIVAMPQICRGLP